MRAVVRCSGLALASGLTLIAACDPPACPPGSHDEMGRCITDSDAAVDAGSLDAFVPGADAAAGDAFAAPDACTLQDLFEDRDRDGHGDSARPIRACGVTGGVAISSDDCDDDEDTTHPGASELCNGTDDDCDGGVDESLQRLLGTPRMLVMDSLETMAAAGAAGSYVVAVDALTEMILRGIWLHRYDADGNQIRREFLFGTQPSPLLRVVPYGPTAAAVWFASGDLDPRTLRGAPVELSTLSGPVLELGSLVGAADAAITVSSTEHTVIYDSPRGQAVGSTFERDTLVPRLVEQVLPTLFTGQPRGIVTGRTGTLVLETFDDMLRVWTLAPSTLDFSGPAVIDAPGAVATLVAIDGTGQITVATATAESLGLVRFREADLGLATVPVTRVSVPIETPLAATPPSLIASAAGTDFVVGVVTASGGGLEWHHFSASDGTRTSTIIDAGADVSLASVARLSTRSGAIFYVVRNPATGTTLTMQRIGCE